MITVYVHLHEMERTNRCCRKVVRMDYVRPGRFVLNNVDRSNVDAIVRVLWSYNAFPMVGPDYGYFLSCEDWGNVQLPISAGCLPIPYVSDAEIVDKLRVKSC